MEWVGHESNILLFIRVNFIEVRKIISSSRGKNNSENVSNFIILLLEKPTREEFDKRC